MHGFVELRSLAVTLMSRQYSPYRLEVHVQFVHCSEQGLKLCLGISESNGPRLHEFGFLAACVS